MSKQEQGKVTAALEALLNAHLGLDLSIFHGDEPKPDSECEEEMKAALVESVKDVVAKGDYTDTEIAKVLDDFEEALREVYPDAWS